MSVADRGRGPAPGPPLRLLVADDQALVRSGFTMILDAQPDLEVVGQAEDGREAVDLAADLRPDLVLMDVRMPRLDGIAATRELLGRSRGPGTAGAVGTVGTAGPKVLVLTTFDLDAHVYDALRAGASGFLLKDVSPEQLVQGVRTVAAGETLLAPAIVRRLVADFVARPAPGSPGSELLTRLTEREVEVLVELARGSSNAEIASRFVLSHATVKTHVAHILTKLEVRDRVQAVIVAYQSGLVDPRG